MLNQLKDTDFSVHLNQTFRIQLENSEPLELELIDVALMGSKEVFDPAITGQRHPFSLVFRGPHTPLLVQQVYPLEHEAMGRLEIFLVPLHSDSQGSRYEAVFT